MPGGPFDSSKTRVAPVLDAMAHLPFDDWPLGLLLDAEMYPSGLPAHHNYDFDMGCWAPSELGLWPPRSLLRWLVQNVQPLPSETDPLRQKLFSRDPDTIELALAKIDAMTVWPGRSWYIFEGKTFPDAVIETPDTIIVIEGKRTERGPTTSTKWMPGRHQIWRHIDAAWETRENKAVYGMFIVEGDSKGKVPVAWLEALSEARSERALESSLPHRSPEERRQLLGCLRGITTWQKLCDRFKLDRSILIDRLEPSKD